MANMVLPSDQGEIGGDCDSIADFDDERLCGEVTAFFEMIRKARKLAKKGCDA